MKTPNISERSLNYTLNKLSVSFKTESNLRKNKTSMNQSLELSQFTIKIESKTFKNFNGQRTLLEKHFLSNLQELKSYRVVSDENQITEPGSIFDKNHYWGVEKTSQRIGDFVLQGAGDDLERLKAGREGVLRGFKEAEKSWNGSLPDISHETLAKSLEAIDEKIRELGGSVVDLLT